MVVNTSEAVRRWQADGTVPTAEEARVIAALWLDDMEGPDLQETNLAGFINEGTIDPDLTDWVEGNLTSLGGDREWWSDSQREQAGELGAWLAYLVSAG